ncbi:MAG: MFS transporter [Caldilineae bacterium]|nr:MAG: MFS transporter [Caldilineae bacterium]
MTTESLPLASPVEAEEPFQTGRVLSIVGGHFTHDTYSAFVAPLLPLLIEKLSLSLTLAGGLAAFTQLPAILNPFIGYLADRISLRYFVILAPAVTATLISLMGLAPNYPMLAILLLVTGVSVAAFHAPAPAMIARISGKEVGKGMSLFMAGGELGRTVGPLLAVWAVSTWTLDGFYRVVIFGWAASAVLYWRLHDIPARPERRQSVRAMLPAARRLFLPLLGIVFPRAFLLAALSVYLPTFMSQRGAGLWLAGASLSIYELAGVVGALAGGTLSDRLGRKTILLVGIASSALLMLVFLQTRGWLLGPVLLVLGFTALSTTPVMLAVVQEQMPHNRALANGVYLAISFLTRPLVVLLIGIVGDQFGLTAAYYGSAAIALLALPAVLYLPASATPSPIHD